MTPPAGDGFDGGSSPLARTDAILAAALDRVHRETDRLFAALLPLQWSAAVAAAFLVSPRAWSGDQSWVHEHVWAAVGLGGAVVSLPTMLAIAFPGRVSTRHAVAAGQMLVGSLLIHLSGGRIETHFHIFGSLALLAFYRDWTVLVTASALALADHLLRGMFWPSSIYGVLASTPWRAMEHAAWMGLIDLFLVRSCLQSVQEMGEVAARQATLEATRAGIEETVRQRTAELMETTEELRSVAERLHHRDVRLSDAARFAAALNHPEALATYRAALECLARALRAPCVALYTVGTDGLPPAARCAATLDGEPLEAAAFSGEGLPWAVARSGARRTLQGPFPPASLRIRAGLGEADLDSVIGWPVSFNGRCVGVVLTAHFAAPTEEQAEFVAASLDQLAVRMSAFGVEEQRLRLMADLREQSRALEEAKAEAERANRVKSEFLASMSHELRTPMNSIMGFTARLIRKLGGSIPGRELDALHTVDRNAKHLLGLINEILDLSKIEAGRMELDLERLDLAPIVREAYEQAAPLADGRPIDLVFVEPSGPLTLQGDRTKLRQVATNLISNAIKYTERGEVLIRVEEALDPRLGRVARLSVRDTGVGIPAEQRHRLFQRFTQLDGGAARKAGGTGLGLVISDQFARMHGGRIDVESEFGRGSEFAALIPLKAPEPPRTIPERAAAAGPDRPSPAGPAGRGVTVLCVDDDPDALKLLEASLSDAGYDAVPAGGHDAALEAARVRRPDVICLDLAMPDKDGFEFLRSLHADPELASVPVIVVSATGEQARALGAGARCCLTKPVDSEGLVATVRDLLSRRSGTALVVEDDADASRLIRAALDESGMQVQTASDGREGLARLAEATPTIIVLDLMMPVMDGFTFLDHLQLDPVWKSIPVIILTARELGAGELLKLRQVGATVLAKGRGDAERVVDAVLAAVVPGKRRRPAGAIA
ncbi:response regulator [Paludisphaera soli]|uniref:response regulator n=1 Tax=Paludisphaera soli TaxID=2712865 RepID=UPI0013EAB6E8|nr:response regulator [Paludisphaera soli]